MDSNLLPPDTPASEMIPPVSCDGNFGPRAKGNDLYWHKHKLTTKQLVAVREYAKSGDYDKAARTLAVSRKSVEKAVYRAKQFTPELLESLGLSLPHAVDRYLRPLLDASETKFAQHKGEFTDTVEVADNGIRLQALRTLLELLDAFPKQGQSSVNVGIVVNPSIDSLKHA